MLQSWQHGMQQISQQRMRTRPSWRPPRGCTISRSAPTRSKQRQPSDDTCSVLKGPTQGMKDLLSSCHVMILTPAAHQSRQISLPRDR